MRYQEGVKIIESDGSLQVRQKRSHRAYKHPIKSGVVTIAYHRLSDDIPRGTLSSILKQASLK